MKHILCIAAFGAAMAASSVSAQEIAVPEELPAFAGNGTEKPEADRPAAGSQERRSGTGIPQTGSEMPQTDHQDVTEIKINQPVETESLGNLTIPFMWTFSEDKSAKRVTAEEARSPQPAVLTIDLLEGLAKQVEDDVLAREIASSVAENIGAEAKITAVTHKTDCGKKKCPEIKIYLSAFSGIENGVNRRCAIEIMPSGSRAIVLTMCVPENRKFQPELPEILDQVMSGMQ